MRPIDAECCEAESGHQRFPVTKDLPPAMPPTEVESSVVSADGSEKAQPSPVTATTSSRLETTRGMTHGEPARASSFGLMNRSDNREPSPAAVASFRASPRERWKPCPRNGESCWLEISGRQNLGTHTSFKGERHRHVSKCADYGGLTRRRRPYNPAGG
jgi:hypothetical protein